MIIRNGEMGKQDDLNVFIAENERGKEIGTAEVIETMKDMLCPDRPHHLLIRADGEASCMDALFGAATARALLLARMQPDIAARVYVECAPDETDRIKLLETLGYKDDDGVVRMWRALRGGPAIKPLPKDCTFVQDSLEDESERLYFLERYNAMFGTHHDEEWIERIVGMPDFSRLLLVNANGLMGEMITWTTNNMAVVGSIQTVPMFRRRGVASYLMELARIHWVKLGIPSACFDVWTRLEAAQRLAATSGFGPVETLMRYPGINVGQ